MTAWWVSWGSLAIRILTLLASYASIVGVAYPYLPEWTNLPWWGGVLAIVAILLAAAVVILEVRTNIKRSVFRKSDVAGIRNYMHNWIECGGRVAIWTRDMSWAQNPETVALLTQKANAGELIICIPEMMSLAVELEKAGAELCVYSTEGYEPASRFTISEFARAGSRVAVGRGRGDLHVIETFDSADDPSFYLAQDLINLVRRIRPKPGNRV
jgi:hypothetical protein